jgi:hypothetical protein
LDEDSPLGRLYEERRKESKFYRDARFYSVNQVLDWLKKLGFNNLQTVQTIFINPSKIQSLEPVEEGFGKGLFVVISTRKFLSGNSYSPTYGRITKTKQITDPHFQEDNFLDYYTNLNLHNNAVIQA